MTDWKCVCVNPTDKNKAVGSETTRSKSKSTHCTRSTMRRSHDVSP
jgi:hypothetical protein